MIPLVFVIVCVIITADGRPSGGSDVGCEQWDNSILSWPKQDNMFLLPKMFDKDDMIDITFDISPGPMIQLHLINWINKNSSHVLCSILVDAEKKTVSFQVGGKEVLEDDINNYTHDGNDTRLNVYLKRRYNQKTQENNSLEIGSKSYSHHVIVENMDDLNILQFNGNVKVTDLAFKFA